MPNMQDAPTKPAIAITGSSGLIGEKLMEALSGEYRVVGLDIKPPAGRSPATDWIECDLTNGNSVTRAMAQVRDKCGDRLASVLHLAAYYDFSGAPSPLYRQLTVEGTRRLLHALRTFEVEQFVFSSSLLVMKPAEENELISEESPTEAAWEYPRSKLRAEQVIRNERGSIPAVILRIAGIYDEHCDSIPLAQQMSRIYEKKLESYLFPGDAEHGQPFLHLDDLVECLRKTAQLRRTLGPLELFLIAEPDVMSYEELQDRLGVLIHGQEWPTVRIPKMAAKAGAWVQEKLAGSEETFIKPWMVDLADADYPVAIRHARATLGWEPRHRLRDTLEMMVAQLMRDPEGWYERNHLSYPETEKRKTA